MTKSRTATTPLTPICRRFRAFPSARPKSGVGVDAPMADNGCGSSLNIRSMKWPNALGPPNVVAGTGTAGRATIASCLPGHYTCTHIYRGVECYVRTALLVCQYVLVLVYARRMHRIIIIPFMLVLIFFNFSRFFLSHFRLSQRFFFLLNT